MTTDQGVVIADNQNPFKTALCWKTSFCGRYSQWHNRSSHGVSK
jgi:hypothetical protein